MPVSADPKTLQLTETPFDESNAKISPDGRLIAYQSNESASRNEQEVYVQSFPQPGFRLPVSTRGGAVPRWSTDGRELFYFAPDLTLMSVKIEFIDWKLRLGTPRPLFSTPLRYGEGEEYDVASNGSFLFNVASSERPPAPITVILNWPRIRGL
jgi:dipeptidyl aminopeptidase/acylaminoacyl peptidase